MSSGGEEGEARRGREKMGDVVKGIEKSGGKEDDESIGQRDMTPEIIDLENCSPPFALD